MKIEFTRQEIMSMILTRLGHSLCNPPSDGCWLLSTGTDWQGCVTEEGCEQSKTLAAPFNKAVEHALAWLLAEGVICKGHLALSQGPGQLDGYFRTDAITPEGIQKLVQWLGNDVGIWPYTHDGGERFAVEFHSAVKAGIKAGILHRFAGRFYASKEEFEAARAEYRSRRAVKRAA